MTKRRLFFLLCAAAALLLPVVVVAQSINIDLGDEELGGTATSRIIQLIILVTLLSLAPSILLMVTSFTRIIVVLSLLRSALGIQQTPPNPVLISLALFLTVFIMAPVFEEAYQNGISPLIEEEIEYKEAFDKTSAPFRSFMLEHVREKDLQLFIDMSEEELVIEGPQDTPFQVLIPAFMISELRRAFEIGFLIFVPFLIIDMVVASTLMSMGMMMLPPVLISLPFKLVFFVLIDGWHMLSGSLVESFNVDG